MIHIHGLGSRSKQFIWQFSVYIRVCVCFFVSIFFTPVIHTLSHATFYFTTNTTALSSPYSLPSPIVETITLVFLTLVTRWHCSPFSTASFPCHPAPRWKGILFINRKLSSKHITEQEVQCDTNSLWKLNMCIKGPKGHMHSFASSLCLHLHLIN